MSRQNENSDNPPVGLWTTSQQSLNSINNNQVPAPPSEFSSGSETTSSPYIPTPLSITSNDLPLPKVNHNHNLVQRNQSHNSQSSSSRNTNIHEPPYIPSTFLPSYHSESRLSHTDTTPTLTSTSRLFPNQSNQLSSDISGEFNPALWDSMSRPGPSQYHLFQGVNLPNQPAGSSRSTNNNGNDINVAGYTGIALMDLAGMQPNREPGLAFEGNNPFSNSWSGSNRNSAGLGANIGTGLTLPTWQPGPSSISASQLSQSQSQSQSQSPFQGSTNNSPLSINRQVSASPQSASHLKLSSSSSSNASPRFQPYPKPNQPHHHQRAVSSASPLSSGSMLPPPFNPQQNTQSNTQTQTPTLSMGRSWSEPNLPDNVTQSSGYPGIMYANITLPEGYMSTPPLGGRIMDPVRIGSDEFSQAYEMYNHILSAIPFISPSSQSEPSASSTPDQIQTYDSLIGLASDSYQLLTGSTSTLHPSSSSITMKDQSSELGSLQRGKRRNSNSDLGPSGTLSGDLSADNEIGSTGGIGGGSKKVTTKCLGCGATETPEWRRGPMGPRTLCNACGLVHMKLQRKKRKAEEKARAAATAAAAASTGAISGDGGVPSKPG